jgi:hypothetical protein
MQNHIGSMDFGGNALASVAVAWNSSVNGLTRILKNTCGHDFTTQREKLDMSPSRIRSTG